MKKCPYCGKEYPDEAVRCLIDRELLAGGEPEPLAARAEMRASASPPLLPVSLSTEADPTHGETWTDREMRIVEVALACLMAFGGSILSSARYLSVLGSGGMGAGGSLGGAPAEAWSWVNTGLHEGASLVLLWYVLMRRSRTFADLGVSWVKKDFGMSILLVIAGNVAALLVGVVIAAAGLASPSYATSVGHVASYFFGGGITLAAFLVQFLNPFYEELIVRGYVMTELKQLTNSVWKPIAFSTLLQTSYHFYQGIPLALSAGAMFLVFSIYYSKTNRLGPIILAHLYCDAGAALLYLLHPH